MGKKQETLPDHPKGRGRGEDSQSSGAANFLVATASLGRPGSAAVGAVHRRRIRVGVDGAHAEEAASVRRVRRVRRGVAPVVRRAGDHLSLTSAFHLESPAGCRTETWNCERDSEEGILSCDWKRRWSQDC